MNHYGIQGSEPGLQTSDCRRSQHPIGKASWPITRALMTRWLVAVCAYISTNLALLETGVAQTQNQLRFGGSTSGNDLYYSLPSWQNNNWLNDTLAPAQDWRLGVQCNNSETGVVVRQVAPGSAAARANLEVGDVIVAVAGQQVGIVDGRPVDVGIEVKRRADSQGNVTLLVQDGRSGRLASVRVRLDGSQTSLRGSVVRRDGAYLPGGSQMIVNVENVSRPFYVVRGGEVRLLANPQGDTPFEINYDPAYIDTNDVYQVRARVMLGDRAIYDTITPVRVFGNNPSTNVLVEVSPIQSSALASTNAPVITAGYGYGGVTDAMQQQFNSLYLKYLGRYPTTLEMAGFLASPTPSRTIDELPIKLLSGQTYYDAVGNNNTVWIQSVFQQIIGRPPSMDERDRWLKYFSDLRGSREDVVRALYQSQAPRR